MVLVNSQFYLLLAPVAVFPCLSGDMGGEDGGRTLFRQSRNPCGSCAIHSARPVQGPAALRTANAVLASQIGNGYRRNDFDAGPRPARGQTGARRRRGPLQRLQTQALRFCALSHSPAPCVTGDRNVCQGSPVSFSSLCAVGTEAPFTFRRSLET